MPKVNMNTQDTVPTGKPPDAIQALLESHKALALNARNITSQI